MIDTHTHLYDEKFDADRHEMIERAILQGVQSFYLPNCDSSTIEPMLSVEAMFPAHCYAMMGLHPCYVKDNVEDEMLLVQQWLEKRTFCAIGEIGLDYYWDKTFVQQQQHAFHAQIELALHYQLPIVIHTREATKDTIAIVKNYIAKGLRGVFHCFSGSYETANQIIEMGFYLGVGGVLTYPKAGLQEVIKKIDMKHLVLETDAPYLTPVPFRGKRNESSYLVHIAEKLANVKDGDVKEIMAQTTLNAKQLFQKN